MAISPEEAKRAAAGPLGESMGKFPLIFAKAVMFGESPSRHRPARINNGTAFLLELSCGPVAVTCYQVIDFYWKRLKSGEDCLFQIGECRFDPLSQWLSASPDADLAVLKLSDAQAKLHCPPLLPVSAKLRIVSPRAQRASYASLLLNTWEVFRSKESAVPPVSPVGPA
jgi:hypothetical protein